MKVYLAYKLENEIQEVLAILDDLKQLYNSEDSLLERGKIQTSINSLQDEISGLQERLLYLSTLRLRTAEKLKEETVSAVTNE